MIPKSYLEECFKEGTPQSLISWACFTNHHHNAHQTTKETIQKFKGSELGKCIDFDKLEKLMAPKPEVTKPILTIDHSPKVILELNHQQTSELFNLLDQHKDEHTELHELLYQAMTREILNRIGSKVQP